MTNLTSERVIGLSHNPLKFYNEVDIEGVQIPDEPMEFREFMDQPSEVNHLLNQAEELDLIYEVTHYIMREDKYVKGEN